MLLYKKKGSKITAYVDNTNGLHQQPLYSFDLSPTHLCSLLRLQLGTCEKRLLCSSLTISNVPQLIAAAVHPLSRNYLERALNVLPSLNASLARGPLMSNTIAEGNIAHLFAFSFRVE
jgi:hypothetical protein